MIAGMIEHMRRTLAKPDGIGSLMVQRDYARQIVAWADRYRSPAPDPVPPAYLRDLIDQSGISQQAAARLLRIDPRTMRRWLAGDAPIAWVAIEALRAYLASAPPALARD